VTQDGVPDSATYRAFEWLVERWVPIAIASHKGRRPVGHVDRDLRCVVTAVRPEADDVVSLTLAREDGVPLPAWEPGAHLDLVLPSGAMRQYSLTGDPADLSSYRIAVRRIPAERGGGGGSLEAHGLTAGARVIARGPRNAFPFIGAAGYLFVAGGIGITPILPMLRATIERQSVGRRDVPWTLVYAGRSRATMPFLDEIAEMTAGLEEHVHVWPDDEHGTPDVREILDLAPRGALLYCCGPMPMIDALRAVIPDPQVDALHYERFSPPPVHGGSPFMLTLARTGARVRVGAKESALTAVRRVRPSQAYSCQQGFCGTCNVRVLSGEVEHRDHALAPYERDGHMMLCVSRGRDVTIDA
jgi:ferredoxin-NADP reductase